MKKYFPVFFLFLSACNPFKQQQNISFQYSAYSFHLNQENWKNEFYLAFYLKCNEQGKFKMIWHDSFMDQPKYFEGIVDKDFKKEMDSMIIQINNSQPIIIHDTPEIIYCGFTYCLDYKIDNISSARIQYIDTKERSPKKILVLTEKLNNFIFSKNKNQISPFSVDSYLDTLKRISSFDLFKSPNPPPPPPKNDEGIKRKN